MIRRIIALVVVIALVALIWSGISAVVGFVGGLFGGNAKPAASASASSSNSAGIQNCSVANVSVAAYIGDGKKPMTAIAAGFKPSLWFTVTNTSSSACYFDVGTKAQNYKITSGSEVIWDNAQCDRTADTAFPMLLQPGVVNASPASVWERVHSSASGCGAGQAAAVGGGAYYHFQVTVNGVKSNDLQFQLN
ncbi:MAG: hypothetical protein RL508_437 [Actinomycetota bacterium]|jgi:hypothetical protein